ncbi:MULTISPECIES: DUF4870 domain-containing protein [Nocardiopsis]|uniref:DUF4870 domain-containing protein n=1 Tax=Nocardiopsis sinuspersici TaxID=501010 RepID=A0A1V3BXZ7_9ACTN|nr:MULTISPECIES: DUF4870 domain-containing protein [Nocardiopsis]NYH54161.1 hypothetical protein [Nocardiopsis sinuspersici]OOC52990.1 hypothetical protein NOSIN_03440 [Nocardiopsis sinuspersici]
MSYPSNPPEDPHGQGQQPGQEGSGGYPSQPGHPSGGYPSQPGHPGGGHPDQPGQPGYQQGGYPPPPGGYPGQPGYQEQSGGYPAGNYQQPGYQQGGYQQGGYGQPGGYGHSSATTGQPNSDERQMGLFAHLGGGLLGWLVPLIIYLLKKDESPFIRDQSAQALNFQLLILIGYLISSVLMIVIIGALTWFVVWVVSIVFGILGGMAASRGEWYRYPFNVSWVK